jgi:hypothetical protein
MGDEVILEEVKLEGIKMKEVGDPVKIQEIEKKVVKKLAPNSTWIKTKEVAKTTGKVVLLILLAAGAVAAIGAATSYAEEQMK